MDAAACIGCGACVAACPNGAAQLFTSAKLAHLNLMPQGQAERFTRTVAMVETMETYFGSCTNHQECEAACPKEISIDFIALMNRDFVKAQLKQRRLAGAGEEPAPSPGQDSSTECEPADVAPPRSWLSRRVVAYLRKNGGTRDYRRSNMWAKNLGSVQYIVWALSGIL